MERDWKVGNGTVEGDSKLETLPQGELARHEGREGTPRVWIVNTMASISAMVCKYPFALIFDPIVRSRGCMPGGSFPT
eukprot:1352460-Amorphochlora_amoeboformis.AAC.1